MTPATAHQKPPKEVKLAYWLIGLNLFIHILASGILLFSHNAPPLHLGMLPPLESFYVSIISHTLMTAFMITVIIKQKYWARWVVVAYFLTRIHFMILFFGSISSSGIVFALFSIHLLVFVLIIIALYTDNGSEWFLSGEPAD